MTDRLYYTEPSRTAFDGVVVRSFVHDGRPAAVLDRTAFYPTSGGQPFDTGMLGGVAVLDVVDAGDEVVHVLAAPLAQGATVHGEIDWPRRLDHMQQHTGQHVLSAAFDRLFDDRTLSFHMGSDSASIDLARELTPAEIERAVDDANRVVWEDRPVSIRFVSAGEAARLPLRKEPTREGPLRLIEVDGFDLSACGGTHVSRTGVIGAIAVLASERFRSGSRVIFVCGGRALRALRGYRDAVAGAVRVLSVVPGELPAAVEKLQGEAKELRKSLGRMQGALAVHEAARLRSEARAARVTAGASPSPGAVSTIVRVLDGWDPVGLKAIAAALVAEPATAVALVSSAQPAFAVVARSGDVTIDANQVLRQLLERFGGRGGGKSDLAQGGGLNGDPQAIAIAAGELLRAG
jgi:alanyl-tRNA synthetase